MFVLEEFDAPKILIVEDNAINLKMLAYQVRLLSLPFHAAFDGEEALDAISKGAYALVLMDCMMPKMDGFEASRLIRSSTDPKVRDVPIIGVSTPGFEDEESRCLEAGMNAYLPKPVSLEALYLCLTSWLPAYRIQKPATLSSSAYSH